jgi:ribonuclease-3
MVSIKNIDRKRKEKLAQFQRNIGIRFKNLGLLDTALSHKSYVNESDSNLENNEKLEFLGDAFLGFVISDYLFNQNLYFREGTLARIKSYVVSESALYRVGQNINIHKFLLIGKGEEKSGGRYRKALISDSVEAVLGAYYLDAGYKQARKLVERLFHDEILKVEQNRHEKDYKSILQELVQKKFKSIPQYSVVNTEGPEHKRKFFVEVTFKKKSYGPGIGTSKKQAEQNAACIALGTMKKMRRLKDPAIEMIDETILNNKKVSKLVKSSKRARHSRQDA